MDAKGQSDKKTIQKRAPHDHGIDSFVLEKDIFSNIFDKDIRRVYLYKKAERIARAIHLIAPAFVHSPALHDRLERIAIALVDAATVPPSVARTALARELLTLTSILSMAETGGLLSSMNVEVIDHEVQAFLQDLVTYEDPRISLGEVPTLAALQRSSFETRRERSSVTDGGDKTLSSKKTDESSGDSIKGQNKGHISDKPASTSRRDAIISVLRSRGQSYIRDISTVVREVSEKTIQRELQALVSEGMVNKEGERRWTTYTLKEVSS